MVIRGMLRNVTRPVKSGRSPLLLRESISRRFSSSRAQDGSGSEEEVAAARRWLAKFNPDTIPRSICDVSFSRSSGPGGQNVNKVNSKATLRVPLNSLLPLVPSLLHPGIQSSRYAADKSSSIIIQADDSRKQSDNVQGCFYRLHDMIREVAQSVVRGETSEAQKERVKVLQQIDNQSRLRTKKTHSAKKSARKGSSRSDY